MGWKIDEVRETRLQIGWSKRLINRSAVPFPDHQFQCPVDGGRQLRKRLKLTQVIFDKPWLVGFPALFLIQPQGRKDVIGISRLAVSLSGGPEVFKISSG